VRDIGDACRELENLSTDSGRVSIKPQDIVHSSAKRTPRLVPIAIAATVLGAVLSGIATWTLLGNTNPNEDLSSNMDEPTSPPPPRQSKRFSIDIGMTNPLGFYPLRANIVISPDGNKIASIANLDGVARLYVRDLERLDSVLIENSEDANYPFFFPDSQSIAYNIAESEETQLMKTSLATGRSQVLTSMRIGLRGTWLNDGTIVFPGNFDRDVGMVLHRISRYSTSIPSSARPSWRMWRWRVHTQAPETSYSFTQSHCGQYPSISKHAKSLAPKHNSIPNTISPYPGIIAPIHFQMKVR